MELATYLSFTDTALDKRVPTMLTVLMLALTASSCEDT